MTNAQKLTAEQVIAQHAKPGLRRLYINYNIFPVMKKFTHGSFIGGFKFGGTNDNKQQVWVK